VEKVRKSVLVGFIILSGLFAFSVTYFDTSLSNDELAARVAAFTPEWETYQESLKAEIGARPVAEWEGEPVSAERRTGHVVITVELQGPWAQRDFGLPLILRGPTLRTYAPATVEQKDGVAVYRFDVAEGEALPWVEVQYPLGRRRIPVR